MCSSTQCTAPRHQHHWCFHYLMTSKSDSDRIPSKQYLIHTSPHASCFLVHSCESGKFPCLCVVVLACECVCVCASPFSHTSNYCLSTSRDHHMQLTLVNCVGNSRDTDKYQSSMNGAHNPTSVIVLLKPQCLSPF